MESIISKGAVVPLDKEKAEKNLAAVLEKMRTESDPALLGEYRKLFKKNVSVFRRTWAAAWLLMYYDQKEIPRPGISPVNAKTRLKQEDKDAPQRSLPEEESIRLFISIGRNRRLYPREVMSLISSKTSAEKDDIGNIKILDNYSFVQVRNSKADEIIEALNGLQFRGRTLSVNYAKTSAQTQM